MGFSILFFMLGSIENWEKADTRSTSVPIQAIFLQVTSAEKNPVRVCFVLSGTVNMDKPVAFFWRKFPKMVFILKF
jgi:hypothetical protein